MQITLRRQRDNNEKTFDTNNHNINRWLAGDTGYIASVTGNPAQGNITIPVAMQQPLYNRAVLSGRFILAYDLRSNAYIVASVAPGLTLQGNRQWGFA